MYNLCAWMKDIGCFVVCIGLATSAIARTMEEIVDAMVGTIFVSPHVESADGALTACGLEFTAIQRDFSTRNGAPVKINGSFYFRRTQPTSVFYALKLSVIDNLGASETFTAPANGFIRAPRGVAPIKAIRANSDNAGYALFMGALDKPVLAAYEEILRSNKIQIGFNRRPGQQDVVTTLDLTVVDTKIVGDEVVRRRSNDMVDEFKDCVGLLVK